MPDPEPIRHPTTGEPIAQGPGEQLQRIAWPGAPVVVVTATRPTLRAPAGELLYRLARFTGSLIRLGRQRVNLAVRIPPFFVPPLFITNVV